MSHRPHRARAVLTASLVALVLAGCGGDDDTGGEATTAPTTSASPTATFDQAAAEAEVRTAWESFFDGTIPQETKPTYLERSAELGEALRLAAQDPNAGQSAASVKSVTFAGTDPDRATVGYDILSGGQVVLAGAEGLAVLEDGAWKVSAQTFCQLTSLSSGQAQIAGCG